MKIIRSIYSLYGFAVFIAAFLALFPVFLLFILIKRPRHKIVFIAMRLWAIIFMVLIGVPFRVIYDEKLDKKKSYVFVANHFSFLDIPVLYLGSLRAVFVGKSELQKIPLFGYMFGRIHITVDRNNIKDSYKVLKKSSKVLGEGASLVFFPEGGILAPSPPEMARFKEGAFRSAIEKQIPIVPVTIPYNWIILRDIPFPLLKWHRAKVHFHKPIETIGMGAGDVKELKENVYLTIDKHLKLYNK